jgi:hypothetical protein
MRTGAQPSHGSLHRRGPNCQSRCRRRCPIIMMAAGAGRGVTLGSDSVPGDSRTTAVYGMLHLSASDRRPPSVTSPPGPARRQAPAAGPGATVTVTPLSSLVNLRLRRSQWTGPRVHTTPDSPGPGRSDESPAAGRRAANLESRTPGESDGIRLVGTIGPGAPRRAGRRRSLAVAPCSFNGHGACQCFNRSSIGRCASRAA